MNIGRIFTSGKWRQRNNRRGIGATALVACRVRALVVDGIARSPLLARLDTGIRSTQQVVVRHVPDVVWKKTLSNISSVGECTGIWGEAVCMVICEPVLKASACLSADGRELAVVIEKVFVCRKAYLWRGGRSRRNIRS